MNMINHILNNQVQSDGLWAQPFWSQTQARCSWKPTSLTQAVCITRLQQYKQGSVKYVISEPKRV